MEAETGLAILLLKNTRVLVQGITGREGSARTRFMRNYGTNIVAGVTPGRGGGDVWGVPVYDTIKEAWDEEGPIDASVTFVPGPMVKDAVFEAIDSGVKLVVTPSERTPLHDILEMVTHARNNDCKIIGPGSIGIISPGEAVAGWLGGTPELADEVFTPGHVGVVSRSGGQSSTLPWSLKLAGLGVSTCICMGSEPIVGTPFAEMLPLFEEDEDTHAVAMFGEIGTVAEEDAAQVIMEKGLKKPVVAYIAGAWAKSGMRFSHASAIIEGGKGTAKSKFAALREAGAHVVNRPEEIATTIARLLKR
jgi:succinyl-CoA synthetase alpha subunit